MGWSGRASRSAAAGETKTCISLVNQSVTKLTLDAIGVRRAKPGRRCGRCLPNRESPRLDRFNLFPETPTGGWSSGRTRGSGKWHGPVVVSAVAQPGQISLWHLIMQASWPVFLVMVGLAIASVWCWAVIIEKYFAVRRMNSANDRFEQSFWSGQSLEDLYLALGTRSNLGLGRFMARCGMKRSPDLGPSRRVPVSFQNSLKSCRFAYSE